MAASTGLVSIVTASVVGAVAQLVKAVVAQRLKVFAPLDRAAGALAAGLDLRPTTLLPIGNPCGGTPLIQLWQEAGIDLPLRFLAWEDGAGLSSVIYADPLWLANAREQGRGDRACSEGGRSIRTSRAVPISPGRRGAFATCAFVMSACRPVDWLPIRRPRHRNGGVLAGTSVRKSHHLDVQRQVQRQI
jgi:uncharacterized protein (DUF302 family)